MAECLVAGTRTPPWVRTTEPDDERWAQIRNGRTPPATSAVEKPGSAPRNAPLQAPVPVDLYSRGLWRDEVEAGNLYPVAVDVSSEITIERPVDVVSSFCVDPGNVPDWQFRSHSATALTAGGIIAAFFGVRRRPVERAGLVREHRVGQLEDPAVVDHRFTDRVRRPLPRATSPLHL